MTTSPQVITVYNEKIYGEILSDRVSLKTHVDSRGDTMVFMPVSLVCKHGPVELLQGKSGFILLKSVGTALHAHLVNKLDTTYNHVLGITPNFVTFNQMDESVDRRLINGKEDAKDLFVPIFVRKVHSVEAKPRTYILPNDGAWPDKIHVEKVGNDLVLHMHPRVVSRLLIDRLEPPEKKKNWRVGVNFETQHVDIVRLNVQETLIEERLASTPDLPGAHSVWYQDPILLHRQDYKLLCDGFLYSPPPNNGWPVDEPFDVYVIATAAFKSIISVLDVLGGKTVLLVPSDKLNDPEIVLYKTGDHVNYQSPQYQTGKALKVRRINEDDYWALKAKFST